MVGGLHQSEERPLLRFSVKIRTLLFAVMFFPFTGFNVHAAINACPTPISPNVFVCAPGTISLTATGAVSPTQTYKWYSQASGGAPIGTGSPFSYDVTASVSLFVSIADTNCEGSRDEVIITLTSNPPGPSTTNGASCGPGSVTMSASSTLGNPVFQWFDSPFDGNLVASGSTYSVNLTTVSDTFYVRVVAGACTSSRTRAIARLKPVPPSPLIDDTTRCGPGSVSLSPVLPSGATARWYADSLPASTHFYTGTIFTTPEFSGTVYYFVSTLLNGCESQQREKVYVYYNLGPVLTGAADVARCQPGVFEFSADAGPGSTVLWYDTSAGGSPIATGNTFSTPVISQTSSYWVSGRDAGGCESARREIKALIVSVPDPPLGADTFRCGPGTLNIAVQPLPGFTAQWYASEAGGNPLFSGSVFTTPSISSNTTYYISASIPGCESVRRPIVAMVKPVPSSLLSDTTDRCSPGLFSLRASTQEKVRWYANEQGTEVLSNSNPFEVSLSQSTNYFVSVRDSLTGCLSPISAHFAKINVVNPKADPVAIIAGEATQLSADFGKSYLWEPASTIGNPSQRITSARPSLTTTYKVTVAYESGCSLSDTITVNVTAAEIPDVFTPNGDRIFDTWEIPGAEKFTGNKLTVFNRWGNVVLDQNGYKNDWDGGDLPAGTYYYRYDEGSGKPVRSGTITIVK